MILVLDNLEHLKEMGLVIPKMNVRQEMEMALENVPKDTEFVA